jgi:Leucine-rich repeat (LRR) protein
MCYMLFLGMWLLCSNEHEVRRAIASIEAIGGEVTLDPKSGQPITLNLNTRKAKNDDLRWLKHFPALTVLELERTQIDDLGLIHLAQLNHLQEFFLADTGVGDLGLDHISHLKELRTLCLARTRVTDAGLTKLARLKKLSWLNLIGTHLTDAGVEKLSGVVSIEQILLSGKAITDASIPHFGKLKRLEYLMLSGTSVTEDGSHRLEKMFPCLMITRVPEKPSKK